MPDVPTPAFMAEEEVRSFAASAGRFLDKHATRAATEAWREAGSVPQSLWREAGRAGLLGLAVPETYGGAGADFRFEAALIEQLGRHDALGFAIPLHNAVVVPYLVDFGTEEQKLRYLPGACSGDSVFAIAMTEPSAGSDLQGMRTTARRDGDDYVLSGQKTFISNGLVASVVIVAAKTDPAAGAKGISLFIVDASSAGFERGRLLNKLGQEGRDTVELFFNEVRVPAVNRLGGEGEGFKMLMKKLPQERLVIAWQAMAMIESAMATTLEYVRNRRLFGKSLMDFQNSQFKLAECATQATVAKVFLGHCTERLLRGELDQATASMAKLWITEAQGRIIDECLQLHGGYGYMSEYPIANLYKDARAYRIYGGTSEIMKLLIARSL